MVHLLFAIFATLAVAEITAEGNAKVGDWSVKGECADGGSCTASMAEDGEDIRGSAFVQKRSAVKQIEEDQRGPEEDQEDDPNAEQQENQEERQEEDQDENLQEELQEYGQEDEESEDEDEDETDTNPTDDGLSKAIPLHKYERPRALSELEMTAGKRLLSAKYGNLSTNFMLSADHLLRYWMKTIYKAGQKPVVLPNETNTESHFEKPTLDRMAFAIKPWCEELARVTNESCSHNPLNMESAMDLTRCLLEQDVDAGAIDSGVFAMLVEVMDAIAFDVMPRFEEFFRELPNRSRHHCVYERPTLSVNGTLSASLLQRSEAFSARQRMAIITVGKIKQATDQLVQAESQFPSLLQLEDSLPLLLNETALENVWFATCEALGCNPKSWLGTLTAMHGHAAELIAVSAPAHVIRTHIESLRNSHRVLVTSQRLHIAAVRENGVSSFVQANADISAYLLSEVESHVGTSRYKSQLQGSAGTLDSAYAQMHSSAKALTKWYWCLSMTVSTVKGYARKVEISPPLGIGFSLTFTNGFGTGNSIQSFLDGVNPACNSAGQTFSLKFSVLIGYVGGHYASLRAGVACSAALTVNGCTSSVSAAISVSAGGAFMYLNPTGCIPRTPEIGGFKCNTGLSVGIGIVCCSFNILTFEHDCDDWNSFQVPNYGHLKNYDRRRASLPKKRCMELHYSGHRRRWRRYKTGMQVCEGPTNELQQWAFEAGRFTVKDSSWSNYCLDEQYGADADSRVAGDVYMAYCDSEKLSQRWHWDDEHRLLNERRSTHCLDHKNTWADHKLYMRLCTSGVNRQKFYWEKRRLHAKSLGWYGSNDNLCIDAGDMASRTRIGIAGCNGLHSKQWWYMNEETMYLYGGTMCMDLRLSTVDTGDPDKEDNGEIIVYPCHGEVNQKWFWDDSERLRSRAVPKIPDDGDGYDVCVGHIGWPWKLYLMKCDAGNYLKYYWSSGAGR